MGRLPENTVKKPVFDTPLRRTAPLEVVPEPADGGDDAAAEAAAEEVPADDEADVDEVAAAPAKPASRKTKRPKPEPLLSDLTRRMTLRLTDEDWAALETEAHQRRMAGAKTSTAEVAREVIGSWARRRRSAKS